MSGLDPFLPKSHGTPRLDDRRVFSGIIFINRTGLRWCDASAAEGPPGSPLTNGMVAHFTGRIEDVLRGRPFKSGEDLEQTILRCVWRQNQQLPQSMLNSRTPLQAMKDWYNLKPALFKKQPYYLPGCDS